MKLEVQRYGIKIIPENAQDEAFIEEVLGFKEGEKIENRAKLVRKNIIGTSRVAYLQTERD